MLQNTKPLIECLRLPSCGAERARGTLQRPHRVIAILTSSCADRATGTAHQLHARQCLITRTTLTRKKTYLLYKDIAIEVTHGQLARHGHVVGHLGHVEAGRLHVDVEEGAGVLVNDLG
jgi:hypothetical protein